MKTRIKREKRNVDVRIFDILTQLHGNYKAQRIYKYTMLKHEINALNCA